jgi:hypothetical protein
VSIRFSSRFKGHDDGRIRAKPVAIHGGDTDTAEPVKHLVCESDGDSTLQPRPARVANW